MTIKKQEFVADKAFIVRLSFAIFLFILANLIIYGLFRLIVFLINYYEDKKEEKEEKEKEKQKK